MKRFLHRYEVMSGQVVNLNKSMIKFSTNTMEANRREVCNQLGVREATTPGRFMGLLMNIGRNKIAEFGFLLE